MRGIFLDNKIKSSNINEEYFYYMSKFLRNRNINFEKLLDGKYIVSLNGNRYLYIIDDNKTMKKEKRKQMREKLISKTYLRDVNKYKLEIYYDKEDYYLSIKKILNIEKPFILENGLCLIDNNYYIVEVIPKNENYAMRVFFNENKERLEYYFDISLKNGLDEETRIPYYDDLYTDITVVQENIEVLDEEELQEALNMRKISKAEYNIDNETRDKLLQSIKNKNNKYMNLDLERYLKWDI